MSSETTSYTIAPPGFTPEQRKEFDENGFIAVENALSPKEVDYYVKAINKNMANDPDADPSKHVSKTNIVERDPALTHLIDHPRHIGFVYDIFGEQLKLQLSQFMQRPRHSSHNMWHVDGARALPYGVFSPELPLQVKIGYWLTDFPEANMGNLVVLPGSHREQYRKEYYTHDSIPGEKVLIARKWYHDHHAQ
jgi:ectoine hydroxylase-related dioxygenase (phytanoyl-CoA dioxygenase family)